MESTMPIYLNSGKILEFWIFLRKSLVYIYIIYKRLLGKKKQYPLDYILFFVIIGGLNGFGALLIYSGLTHQ